MDAIRHGGLAGFRVIFRSIMASQVRSTDSDPVLEISAIGTVNSEGEYVQHEAVAPHKPHAATIDPLTVVIRGESLPPIGGAAKTDTHQPDDVGMQDGDSTLDEVTSITNSRLRAKGRWPYRVLTFIEAHRVATLTFAVGSLLLLLAALVVTR